MHFYLLLRQIISFLVFNTFIASIQSILRTESQSQTPLIYPVGTNVRIKCPIFEEDYPELLFFEWFDHNKEPIKESSRISINDRGVLKIKSALVDDTGIYICKGINGFGFETVSVSLQIVSEEDPRAPDNQIPFQFSQNDNFVLQNKPNTESRPLIPNSEIKMEKAVGLSVTFNCNNKARAQWLKNGRPLGLSDLPNGSSLKRGTLSIPRVRVEDSGNYSCISRNGRNNTFVLIVFDKPELTGFHPINSSVVLGERAVFHCKVRSEVKPFIQWLGSCKNVKDSEEAKSRGIIQIKSEFYRVLKSTKIVKTIDGNYYKNLIIEKTQLNDSGNYICLAAYTNPGSFNFSFIYKSTYLTVLPINNATEKESGLSISTIFWISFASISCIVGILTAFLNHMQKRHEKMVDSAINNNHIQRTDNMVDKPRESSIHYYFRPDSSLAQSIYTPGINTNGNNCSSDRLTHQT